MEKIRKTFAGKTPVIFRNRKQLKSKGKMEARVGIEPAYTELQFDFFTITKIFINNRLYSLINAER
jgi:hypothetical protein